VPSSPPSGLSDPASQRVFQRFAPDRAIHSTRFTRDAAHDWTARLVDWLIDCMESQRQRCCRGAWRPIRAAPREQAVRQLLRKPSVGRVLKCWGSVSKGSKNVSLKGPEMSWIGVESVLRCRGWTSVQSARPPANRQSASSFENLGKGGEFFGSPGQTMIFFETRAKDESFLGVPETRQICRKLSR